MEGRVHGGPGEDWRGPTGGAASVGEGTCGGVGGCMGGGYRLKSGAGAGYSGGKERGVVERQERGKDWQGPTMVVIVKGCAYVCVRGGG